MPGHPNYGHGHVVLQYANPGAATAGQHAIFAGLDANRHPTGGSAKIKASVIRSIDQRGAEPAAGALGGAHGPGDRVLLEIEAGQNEPIRSQAAHDTLVEVGTWAAGLSGAPGVEFVWCCYQDQ